MNRLLDSINALNEMCRDAGTVGFGSDEDAERFCKYHIPTELTDEDKETIAKLEALGFGTGYELRCLYRDANLIAPFLSEGWSMEEIEKETYYDRDRILRAKEMLEKYVDYMKKHPEEMPKSED